MGKVSQRDVILCAFISEDKLLLKMRTDRKEDHYWTVIDQAGYICDTPRILRRVL